ncbi:MauE/DoxX family redox-associated membrane protein [Micromonospora sp. CPCC 206061]|uniref:MauE/DoxX family redox-associated membrane protein n=1 Tax=Micromonospora sp. CPCC 206061 TaxID=3122410 RepID=UPI002FEF807A
MAYLVIACQAMLIGVFAASTITKVRSRRAYADFRRSVEAFRVLPPTWSRMAARATVTGEAAVVLLLALPLTAPIGFALAAGLLCAFTVAIVLALRGGRTAPCRCFGASAEPLSRTHLIRNLLLLTLSLTGLATGAIRTDPARDPAGLTLSLAVAAVAALFVVRFDDVVALLKPPASDRHHAARRR